MSKFAGMALAVDKPLRLIINDPRTGEPMTDAEGREAFVEVWAADSEVGRKADRAAQIERMKMRQVKAGALHDHAAEALTEKLVALTMGGKKEGSWHLVAWDGAVIDLPCTEANVRDLYNAPEMRWLRDQVQVGAHDPANFMPGSSATSSPPPSTASNSTGQ